MSKIALEGNASGTGTFTVAAPNSNSNYTLTLPQSTGTVVVTGGAQTIEFAAGTASTPSITFTGDTNTGIFSPAADTIAFAEGGAESMRIDSSGNLGLGVTPSAWDVTGSGGPVLQIKRGLFFGADSETRLIHNAYYGTGDFRYIATGVAATNYQQASGQHRWFNAASGTAGNAISFTQAMTLDASGNLGVGQTSPSGKLDVRTGTGSNIAQFIVGLSGGSSIYYDANTHYFRDGSFTERMRIDSSGNVGIGTTSLTGKFTVRQSSDATNGGIVIEDTSGGGAVISRLTDGGLTFRNGGLERARITSGGNLLVGTTTSHSLLTVQGQGSFGSTGSGGNGIYLYINNTLSDNSYLSRASAGNATTTWYIGNQTITTSSDIRLKDNIKPTERNAIELLNQWEIVDHTWNDPSDQCENNRNSRGVWTGVVAQQVQPITPWLVNKPTEEVNEDGTINPWTMDFGYAVPLLVKAIQELKAINDAQAARIETLETKVAALENK